MKIFINDNIFTSYIRYLTKPRVYTVTIINLKFTLNNYDENSNLKLNLRNYYNIKTYLFIFMFSIIDNFMLISYYNRSCV